MPQPIDRIIPDPHVFLKSSILDDKPEFAVLVCKIFAVWARVEQRLAVLLVRVLGAESAPALAIYSTLTAQHLQLGALEAAAKAKLPTEDYQIFKAALSVSDRAQGPRNHLAHWSWGGCRQLPDVLALADPKMLSNRDYRLAKVAHSADGPESLEMLEIPNLIQFEKSQILAYRIGDLQRAVRDLDEAEEVIKAVVDYIDPSVTEAVYYHLPKWRRTKDEIRAEALQRLNDKQLFREALARIRGVQKSISKVPDGPNPPEPAGS